MLLGGETISHWRNIVGDPEGQLEIAGPGRGVIKMAAPQSGANLKLSDGRLRDGVDTNRAHNSYYEPCPFYARKGMLHRFNFVNFSKR